MDATLVVDALSLATSRLLVTPEGVRLTTTDGLSLTDLAAPWGLTPVSAEIYDKVRGADDMHCVVRLLDETGESLGVRVSRNGYTDEHTVAESASVQRHYEAQGIPVALTRPTLSGDWTARVDGWTCSADTWLKGCIAWDVADELDQEALNDALVGTAARACATPGPRVSAVTSWSITDPFPGDSQTEAEQVARELHAALSATLGNRADLDALLSSFLRGRERFVAAAAALPQAPVQGDLNWSNVVVDAAGRFAGLLDFNLAGMDCCLNYLFCESVQMVDSLDEALSETAAAARDDTTRRRLSVVGETYRFSAAERRAFPLLYRLRVPTFWPVSRMLLDEIGHGRADDVVTWVRREASRTDDELLDLLPA